MERPTEGKQQRLLSCIAIIISQIPAPDRTCGPPERLQRSFSDLYDTIKQHDGKRRLPLKKLELWHQNLVWLKANSDSNAKAAMVPRQSDDEIDIVLAYLKAELDKEFKEVPLWSINTCASHLASSSLSQDQKSQILDKLGEVYKAYEASENHIRLDKLIDLFEFCYPLRKVPELNTLLISVHHMICVIMNTPFDEPVDDSGYGPELQEKLRIRTLLRKFKLDFVTMPPPETPQGELLRDYLAYEQAPVENRRDIIRRMGVKAFTFENDMRHVNNELYRQGKKKQLQPPLALAEQQLYHKKPHLGYRALLAGYMINAIRRGDIRPWNKQDAFKDFTKQKHEYTPKQREKHRLYPNTQTRMLLHLVVRGKKNDQSLCFTPFSTHEMKINDGIPHRCLVVMSASGSLYWASISKKVVHSTLAHNAYFGGYLESYFGRWTEIGTICGSFRTTEKNALNFARHIIDTLGLYDPNVNPQFYVDNRHSEHLLEVAIHHYEDKLYELIYPFPKKPYTTKPSTTQADQPDQSSTVLTLKEAETEAKRALEREKYLKAQEEDARVIDINFKKLAYFYLNREPLQLTALRLKQHPELAGVIIPRVKETPFEKIARITFAYHKTEIFQPNKKHQGRVLPASYVELLSQHTVFFRETVHHEELNFQTRSTDKLIELYTALPNIHRTKTRGHRRLEKLLENNLLGIFICTIMMGLITPLYFYILFNVFALSSILALVTISTVLSLITNGLFIKKDDIIFGFATNLSITSVLFLFAVKLVPIAAAVAAPAMLCTLSLFLLIAPFGAAYQIIHMLLDRSIHNRVLTQENYPNTTMTGRHYDIRARTDLLTRKFVPEEVIRLQKAAKEAEREKIRRRRACYGPPGSASRLYPKPTHTTSNEDNTTVKKSLDIPLEREDKPFPLRGVVLV